MERSLRVRMLPRREEPTRSAEFSLGTSDAMHQTRDEARILSFHLWFSTACEFPGGPEWHPTAEVFVLSFPIGLEHGLSGEESDSVSPSGSVTKIHNAILTRGHIPSTRQCQLRPGYLST